MEVEPQAVYVHQNLKGKIMPAGNIRLVRLQILW